MEVGTSFKRQLYPSMENAIAWLQALVFLVGLVFFNWNPVFVVFAYFFETIIVGIIHTLKLLMVIIFSKTPATGFLTSNVTQKAIPGIGVVFFFLIHYFLFVFVQSIFVFSFFGSTDKNFKDGFYVIHNYMYLLRMPEMQLAVLCITMANIGYTIKNFIIPGNYKTAAVNKMFMQPYGRIIVQQFVAVASGFFFIISGSGFFAAILLIIARLISDLVLIAIQNNTHFKEKVILYLSKKGSNPQNARMLIGNFFDK
jgi:hypothetical protein